MEKSVDAFRTISEVADDLDLPQHVLRFWETRFAQIRPLKRAGGRRYYRPADVVLLRSIRQLLYDEGYTIKGVQRLLKEKGPRGLREEAAHGGDPAADFDDADTAYDETGGAEGPDGFGHPSAAAPLQSANDREAVASAGSDEIGRGAVFSAVTDSSMPGFDPRAFDAGPYGRVGLDRTALAEILVTIEECHRILIAVRRPRS